MKAFNIIILNAFTKRGEINENNISVCKITIIYTGNRSMGVAEPSSINL